MSEQPTGVVEHDSTRRDQPRARIAVTTYFVITGLALAAWNARIPSIKQRLGLDDAQISLALLAVAIGSVLAMQLAGRLADRYGSDRVMGPAGVLTSVMLVPPGYVDSFGMLLLSLLVFGFGHGALDVSMNTAAVAVERRYGRPILGSIHAMFSIGGLLGAGSGALAARWGVGPGTNLLLVGIALGALSLLTRRWLLPGRPDGHEHTAPVKSGFRVPPMILFLGALGLFCSVGEGSVGDWSAIYLHEELGTGLAVAPLGFAVFSATMALVRFLGDRLSARFGPVLLVRGCGTIAGVGLGTALLIGHPVAAIVGFGLFGVGLSCIIPQVFSAAGNRDPQRSGRDLAQVSTLSYGGLLAGPVLIGLLAHRFGLTIGLAVPALLALFVAASAHALRPAR